MMTSTEETVADVVRRREISEGYGGDLLAPMMLAVVRETRAAGTSASKRR